MRGTGDWISAKVLEKDYRERAGTLMILVSIARFYICDNCTIFLIWQNYTKLKMCNKVLFCLLLIDSSKASKHQFSYIKFHY